jgi:YVTN family beta-propeller protein
MNGRTLIRHLILSAILCTLPALLSAQTLLVGNKTDNTVDLIDLDRGESRATLPTGVGPHEIAVAPGGTLAAISNYGSRENRGSSLTLIDLVAEKVINTIELGEHTSPHGMAWLDADRLVVTTEGSAHLLIVNPHLGKILAAIPTDQQISHMVAVTPNGERAFVANIGSGTVTVIDLVAGKKITDLPTGEGAEGITVSADGSKVWVTNRAADTLSVINARTLAIERSHDCASFPIRIALTPNGKHALVSVARTGEVVQFDPTTGKETARAKLDLSALPESTTRLFGDQFGKSPVPVGLVIAPDGRTAWVAATQADMVVAIDPRTLEVKGLIRAGKEPDGMAYSPR